MKLKLLLLAVTLIVTTSLALGQTTVWEKSVASGNYPSFMGASNTETGLTAGMQTLQPFSKIWVQSAASGNYPSYMGTGSTERGMAFGTVGGNDRVLVVSRKSGNVIFVLKAATGDTVGRLNTSGITGGLYAINDAEISSDGVIYVCNMTSNPSTSPFKVYKWSSEGAAPQLALSYTGATVRFGDKFTVTGSTADNSVTIWAAGATSDTLVKFTTTDNGVSFTPTLIRLGGPKFAATPVAYSRPGDTVIYAKSNSINLKRCKLDGTFIDSLTTTIIPWGANAFRYFEANGRKYLVVYIYGSGNEKVRAVDVTNGLASASLVGASPVLGAVLNSNGVGDVDIRVNGDNTVNAYFLGTNNGIAAYRIDPTQVGSHERMYLASRNGGNQLLVLDPATGHVIRQLDTTGLAAIASGDLAISDAEMSSDGNIYVCNLTTSASASAFKVYRWKDETSMPQRVVNYNSADLRLGDKFTVTGSTANSSVAIWVVGAGSTKVLKFTTADSGKTFTSTEITLSGNPVGSGGAASVCPNLTAGELYIKANGDYVKRYLMDGTFVDSIAASVVGTESNALRYFELGSRKYLALFTYGAGSESAKIVDVTNGLGSAVAMTTTPSLGTMPNSDGNGDVNVKANGGGTATIYVLGTNNGIGNYLFAPKAAPPVFTPVAGTYHHPIWMKLSDPIINARIFYTTDGSTPDSTAGATLFADSVQISDTATTVKAIAYVTDMQPSDVATVEYRITPPEKVAAPVFSPVAGIYLDPVWLKISSSTPGAKIYYTLNGAPPDSTAGSTLFADSVQISDTVTTVKAIAYAPDMLPSDVVSATYRIGPQSKVDAPAFSPVAGTYHNPFYLKLSVLTSNAKIYYTMDGTTPDSAHATLFADSVLVSDTVRTVKAIAYAHGLFPSDVVTATYRVFILPPVEQLYTDWAKTKAAETFPHFFSTGDEERGMAYGKVGGKDRVYVVSRKEGEHIYIFDALTGDSVGMITPSASVSGGTFPLNAVGVSEDGLIFAGNMTLDVAATSFKVYRWDSEADSAKTVIDYVNPGLSGNSLGDMISVSGKASDNSLTIFAAAPGKENVVKFTTSDNGTTFTPQVVTLANGPMGSNPSVAQAPDTTLYVKSYGHQLFHYTASGAVIDSIPSDILGLDGDGIRYFERLDNKYVVVHYPNGVLPYTNERVAIVDVTNPVTSFVAFASPSIGDVPNINGNGTVDVMPLANDNFLVFLLGTNNGLAAFTNSPSVVVSNLDTMFCGTSKNLLANPYGAGYVAGTNERGDRGKYQRFAFNAGDKLFGIEYWFGYRQIVDSPDTLLLVVKGVELGGVPGATISTVTTTTDKIDVANGNIFLLDSTLTVDGPVFIGVEWASTANDTIALYSDKNGEGESANRSWEKRANGSYSAFANPLNSWSLDVDLWIAAYYKKNTITSVYAGAPEIVTRYSLAQNYPNPFNPSTTIEFTIPERSRVSLKIYDILGRQVADLMNADAAPGNFRVQWNAQGVATGVYFYRLQAGKYTEIRKMVLVK